MPTQLLVETPVHTTSEMPAALSAASMPLEPNAPMVVLLTTSSPGSGLSSSTISCSRVPTRLLVARKKPLRWAGASL